MEKLTVWLKATPLHDSAIGTQLNESHTTSGKAALNGSSVKAEVTTIK
jgi:hypothetical protein